VNLHDHLLRVCAYLNCLSIDIDICTVQYYTNKACLPLILNDFNRCEPRRVSGRNYFGAAA